MVKTSTCESSEAYVLVVNVGLETVLRYDFERGAEVLHEATPVPCGKQLTLLSDRPFTVKVEEPGFARVLRSRS